MILAAGLGTRLRPLTDELPKPLVPVGDRPAAAHVAARLAAASVTAAVINTHHLAEAFTPEVMARFPIDLHVIHEPAILGTGGGVANARPLLGGGDVIVWNGDILAEIDLGAMVARHRAAGAPATLAIAPRPGRRSPRRAGGRVVRLRGERFGEEIEGGDFLGVYVLTEAFRDRLPSPGCLVGDGCLPLLREGRAVASFIYEGSWDDIGSVASYLAANARWLARGGLPSFTGEGATRGGGIDVAGSVIGAGAEITGEGSIRGCVVWPGAVARAPLEGAVVTPRGVVKPPAS